MILAEVACSTKTEAAITIWRMFFITCDILAILGLIAYAMTIFWGRKR